MAGGAALVVLPVSLHGASPWGLSAVAGMAILAFTDVWYAAYLNSFYMDAAALSSLLLMVSAAACIARIGRSADRVRGDRTPLVDVLRLYGFDDLFCGRAPGPIC